jgi:hypothetical protein
MMKTQLKGEWFIGFSTLTRVELEDYQERVVEDMLNFAATLYLVEKHYNTLIDEVVKDYPGFKIEAHTSLDDDLITVYSEFFMVEFEFMQQNYLDYKAENYPHRADPTFQKVARVMHSLGVQHATEFKDKYRALFAKHLAAFPLLPQAAFVLACEEAEFNLAHWAKLRPEEFYQKLQWAWEA